MGDQARVRSVREGQDLPLDFVILGQCTYSFGYMASITRTSSRVIDDGSPLSLRVLDQITTHLRVPSRDGLHPEQCTQPEHPPHVHTMRPDRERTLERVGIHVPLVREPTISHLAHPAYRWRKERADERTRTAELISLGVCGRWLLSVAGVCKSRISKGFSFLRGASCCTVLLS